MTQSPGIAAGELAIVAGSMPDGQNMLTGVTTGPGYRNGGDIVAATSKVRPVDGQWAVTVYNSSSETDSTFTLELLLIPLPF